MLHPLILIACAVGATSGCSLVFESGAATDAGVNVPVFDAGAPPSDAGPNGCERRPLLSDSFDMQSTIMGELSAGAEVMDGGLVLTLDDAGSHEDFRLRDREDLDYIEFIADLESADLSGTVARIGLVDTQGTRIISAGKLTSGFGWQTAPESPPTLIGAGAFGKWRLRRSGIDILVENYDPGRDWFREDGRAPIPLAGGEIALLLEALRLDTGAGEARFNSLELSASPEGGWCSFEQFRFVPGEPGANALFEITTTEAAVGQISNSELRLVALMPTSLARARSTSRYNLENSAVVIHVGDVAADPIANVIIEFHHSSINRFSFWFSGQLVQAITQVGGVDSPVAQRVFTAENEEDQIHYLRARPVAGNRIAFDVSSDSAKWQPLNDTLPTLEFTAPLDDLEIHISADGVTDIQQPVSLDIKRIYGEPLPPPP